MKKRLAILTLLVLALAGCSTTGMSPAEQTAYMVAASKAQETTVSCSASCSISIPGRNIPMPKQPTNGWDFAQTFSTAALRAATVILPSKYNSDLLAEAFSSLGSTGNVTYNDSYNESSSIAGSYNIPTSYENSYNQESSAIEGSYNQETISTSSSSEATTSTSYDGSYNTATDSYNQTGL